MKCVLQCPENVSLGLYRFRNTIPLLSSRRRDELDLQRRTKRRERLPVLIAPLRLSGTCRSLRTQWCWWEIGSDEGYVGGRKGSV